MNKEQKEERKRKEERMSGEMTSELVYVPQCSLCKNLKSPNQCEVFGEVPEKYLNNLDKCPNRNLISWD